MIVHCIRALITRIKCFRQKNCIIPLKKKEKKFLFRILKRFFLRSGVLLVQLQIVQLQNMLINVNFLQFQFACLNFILKSESPVILVATWNVQPGR
jgi:hypothetical protein